MSWLFSKKPTASELQRENERALRRAGRDVEKDRLQLEKQEKSLIADIRKEAAKGNNPGAQILAKQLVSVRKQKARTYGMNSKIQSVGAHGRAMNSNVKLAEAMSTTATTMKNMNAIAKPEQVAANMMEFRQAAMKMEMTDEMINDTLDDILNDSDDESEENAIVNQVLDEIGIEIHGKLREAPNVERSGVDHRTADETLEAQLSRLRSN